MFEKAGLLRENKLASATLTADSEAAGYPVTDILNARHDLPWRSTAGTGIIKADFGSSVALDTFLIRVPSERDPNVTPNVPVSSSATVIIRASDTEGGNDLLNESFAAGHHERLGYIGRILLTSGALNTVTARYWEIEIQGGGTFVEVETVFAGMIWFPGFNYNKGNLFGIDEQAEKARSSFSGGTFAEARSRLVEFTGAWSIWSVSELDDWEEFFLAVGTTKPFALFRKTDGDLSKRATIVTIEGKPVTSDDDGAHFLTRINFKENR